MLLTPDPLSQIVTPFRTTPPSVTYFMDGPLLLITHYLCFCQFYCVESWNDNYESEAPSIGVLQRFVRYRLLL